jgi:hypothetical protein
MPGISTLYRPVGQAEFELVRASGFRSFPPRLAHQPIFYPVLSEQYATQIARDWNPKDETSGFVGCVLRFHVRTEFLNHYEVHVAGSSKHREYWIPAEDLRKPMKTSWEGSRSCPSSADDPEEQHGEAWLALRANLDQVRAGKRDLSPPAI